MVPGHLSGSHQVPASAPYRVLHPREARLWSDSETAVDSLNVQHLVRAILHLLDMEQLSPVTIGVYGDWGSGKSSVVTMLKEQLAAGERKDTMLCVVFNGWRFDGYEDAKSALMTTILKEIEGYKTFGADVREAATKLLRRVDWMRVGKSAGHVGLHATLAALTGGTSLAGTLAAEVATRVHGVDAEKIAAAIGAHLSEAEQGKKVHESVREFERDFASVLKQTNLKRLVVVIDDLDRCNPTQVIETLEAIRLFLAVPSTAFIIAADERMVQHAARLRFPGMEGLPELGRDYLEKMIQIPVRVPPLGQRDLETYLNMLFLQLHATEEEFKKACERSLALAANDISFRVTAGNASEILGKPLTEDMRLDLGLAAQVRQVVAVSVDGNPRQVKRYLNAFRLRMLLAEARGVSLDPRVAAKLMLLEYFRLEAFRTVARWQAAHEGVAEELHRIEAHRAPRADDDRITGESAVPARPPAPRATSSARGAVAAARTAASGTIDGAGTMTRSAPTEGPAVTPSVAAELPPEMELWATDEWMRVWLEAEPLLGQVDLQPYFYFARDRLVGRSTVMQRMGPAARDLLGQLLSPSKAVRDVAASRANEVIATDAVAILEALAERVRASDNTAEASLPFQGMLALVRERQELVTEFISVLRSLPLTHISTGTPNRLQLLMNTIPAAHEGIRGLLTGWSIQSDNPDLAVAVRQVLENIG